MTDSTPPIRCAVGVMTGTSIDGIDAALIKIQGEGFSMRASLLRHCSHPLGEIANRLRKAAEQELMTAGELATLAWDFGQLHCEAIDRVLDGNMQDIALICVHGQTVFHQPPVSWQLINPAPIAARFTCPIVSDLRQADLASGGQGAPITPIADWILFRDSSISRAIINLGGFCNVTILPRDDFIANVSSRTRAPSRGTDAKLNEIRGFDVCACNQVLDAVARSALNAPFDRNGAAASRGRAQPQAAGALRQILKHQREKNRSLGTGDEATKWVNEHRTQISPDDLAASAADAIARSIAEAIAPQNVDQLVIAGGGAYNRALLNALGRFAGKPMISSAELGVSIEAREAMAFAVLGALCADGVPITLPQVTGCRAAAPLAGSWLLPIQPIDAPTMQSVTSTLHRD